MKHRTYNSQSVSPLQNKEGNLVNDDEEQANILNEFFSSVLMDKDTSNIVSRLFLVTNRGGETIGL